MSFGVRPLAISHSIIYLVCLHQVNTAFSVMHMSTQVRPVRGNVHFCMIFEWPFNMCSMVTITRLAPETRSIAPPIPFTIFDGIIQLAKSPLSETYKPPSKVRSICPPLIMANDSDEEKKLPPGYNVTGNFPALIKSESKSCSHSGYPPSPRYPFSDWKVTSIPGGIKSVHSVGIPIPRLTYMPYSIS